MAAKTLSALERNILKAKGLTEDDLEKLVAAGIRGKQDFHTVGDPTTLVELIGASPHVAEKVMAWALGPATTPASGVPAHGPGGGPEAVATCFWCSASGTGKFCRRCGAEFVPNGELELALLLKREGIPKQDISTKLKMLSPDEKEQLWGRVRRSSG